MITEEMRAGNEPICESKEFEGAQQFETDHGSAHIKDGEVLCCNYSVNAKISIYVVGVHLWIVDRRYSGKCDAWEYTNDGYMKLPGSHCMEEQHRHELEEEKIQRIIGLKRTDYVTRCLKNTLQKLIKCGEDSGGN